MKAATPVLGPRVTFGLQGQHGSRLMLPTLYEASIMELRWHTVYLWDKAEMNIITLLSLFFEFVS